MGALAASIAHNDGVGIVGAVLAGALIGALLAVFAIKYFVNQVILGVVLNVFALGLTGLFYDSVDAEEHGRLQQPARARRRSRSRCSATSR